MVDRPTLEQRVRAIEDDLALRDLMSRYAFYADSGQHDAWVDLFTTDGEIDLIGGESTGTHANHMRWSGTDELTSFIDDPDVHMSFEGRCMHITTANMRTQIKGDDAAAEAYYLLLLRKADDVVVAHSGFTRLRFRRVDGSWRIRQRLRHTIGTDVAELRDGHPELDAPG